MNERCGIWLFWVAFIFANNACFGQQTADFGQKNSAQSSLPIQSGNPIPTPVIAHQISDERYECRGGFSVRKSLRSNLKAKTRVKFEDILTNAGGWNSKDDVFVAPCPGTYFFTFHALSEKGKDFTLALMKNHIYQVTGYGAKAEYQWGSNSALLYLNKDDIVYLDLQDGEIYEHPLSEAYTTFTGFLVNKY